MPQKPTIHYLVSRRLKDWAAPMTRVTKALRDSSKINPSGRVSAVARSRWTWKSNCTWKNWCRKSLKGRRHRKRVRLKDWKGVYGTWKSAMSRKIWPSFAGRQLKTNSTKNACRHSNSAIRRQKWQRSDVNRQQRCLNQIECSKIMMTLISQWARLVDSLAATPRSLLDPSLALPTNTWDPKAMMKSR